MKKLLILTLALCLVPIFQKAQSPVSEPKVYTLSGLEVEGAKYSDQNAVKNQSGLVVGRSFGSKGV